MPDTWDAVSYTHLDVYKRQGFSRKLRLVSTSTNSLVDSLECPYRIPVTTNVVSVGNQVFIVSGEVPVSYTHLIYEKWLYYGRNKAMLLS